MNSIKIKHKAYLFTALILVFLLCQTFYIRYSVSEIQAATNNRVQNLVPTTQALTELRFGILQVQQWLTDISATRALDGLNDGFEEAEKSAQYALQTIANLKTRLPDQSSQLNTLQVDFDSYYSTGKKMAAAYIELGPAGGNQLMASFDAASEALQKTVGKLADHIEQLSAVSTAQITSAAGHGKTSTTECDHNK